MGGKIRKPSYQHLHSIGATASREQAMVIEASTARFTALTRPAVSLRRVEGWAHGSGSCLCLLASFLTGHSSPSPPVSAGCGRSRARENGYFFSKIFFFVLSPLVTVRVTCLLGENWLFFYFLYFTLGLFGFLGKLWVYQLCLFSFVGSFIMTAGLCLYFYNDYCLIPVIFLFTVSWVHLGYNVCFAGKRGLGCVAGKLESFLGGGGWGWGWGWYGFSFLGFFFFSSPHDEKKKSIMISCIITVVGRTTKQINEPIRIKSNKQNPSHHIFFPPSMKQKQRLSTAPHPPRFLRLGEGGRGISHDHNLSNEE